MLPSDFITRTLLKRCVTDDKVMSTAEIYKTTTVIVSAANTMLTGYIFHACVVSSHSSIQITHYNRYISTG